MDEFENTRRAMAGLNPLKGLIEQHDLIRRTLTPAIRAHDLQLHVLGLQQESLSAAVHKFQLDFQPVVEQFHDASAQFRAIGLDLENQLVSNASYVNTLSQFSENAQSSLKPLLDSFRQLAGNADLSALGYLKDHFNTFVVDTTEFDLFRRSAGYAYLNYINQLEAAAEDETRIAEIFDDFFGFLYSIWEKLPKNIVSWQFIIGLLKDFIILYLLVNPSNERMEERIKENTKAETRASEERTQDYLDSKLQELG